jgi:hypothetical protein
LTTWSKGGEVIKKGGRAMKFGTLTQLGVCFLLLFATGCTTYYRITDHATGRVYYTTDYDRTGSGAVRFDDAKSRTTVTLQSSEISEISRPDFEAGMRK